MFETFAFVTVCAVVFVAIAVLMSLKKSNVFTTLLFGSIILAGGFIMVLMAFHTQLERWLK